MKPTHSPNSRRDLLLIGRFLRILEPRDRMKPSAADMRRRAREVLEEARAEGTLEHLVRQLVLATGLDAFLPDAYRRFQPAVLEGMVFLLTRMTPARLGRKIVEQLRLPPSADPGRRLLVLIKDMPTLQKLGQVIARNPRLDPRFRASLVDLEDNLHTMTYAHLRRLAEKQVKAAACRGRIMPQRRILSEASVCAVVPARVEPATGPSMDAVLKFVKPRVRRTLKAELRLLDSVAEFMEGCKEAWGLSGFRFREILQEARGVVEREVDLISEQKNLAEARSHYASNRGLLVPAVLKVSTPFMTVMAREEGRKITDVGHLDAGERRRLAQALVDTCILAPVRELRGTGIFHGDPHAGNLAYRFSNGKPVLILYDWAVMGRLNRLEQFAFILLTLGLILGNAEAVFYAGDMITGGQLTAEPDRERVFRDIVRKTLAERTGRLKGILASVEALFEAFTYEGVVFSADLMMYKKALFTLQGVLAEVDPTFDRDAYLVRAAAAAFLDDLFRIRLRPVMREIWSLYRRSFMLFFRIQKVILRFLVEVTLFWARLPGKWLAARRQ
ncbi:MAG: AarF/ABC1/UbiB kinase family protein [Deltaproteobacteria bacterium]|nr:AarF/ABC1/UbiB kinase family protein [Deltaproteobacteria bacterium]MBW2347183.1 AarF/ABC1/UbiB kinase family protein [Deltaproteobacteria bacterium]